MKKTFVGIGSGPIQTGIFVSGAAQGGYERIVLADVDAEIVNAVRKSGSITVNTAGSDAISTATYGGVEIYDPTDPDDRRKLIEAAREALVVSTALPSTAFYTQVAPWLKEAFAHEVPRYVYAAENSTTAAEELEAVVGSFPQTFYLDTVIGKMSKVFASDELNLRPLAPCLRRGHLVEAFNDIYTSSAPGIESTGMVGFYPKDDLRPFEDAKLYGHNTCHFLLGLLADEQGCIYVDEASRHPQIVSAVLDALLKECAVALDRKYGADESFVTPRRFTPFALHLVARMLSPQLQDSVARIIRDPQRKLGWNDRMIGAIRLCREQGVEPVSLYRAVARACRRWLGGVNMGEQLRALWPDAPPAEADLIVESIRREV